MTQTARPLIAPRAAEQTEAEQREGEWDQHNSPFAERFPSEATQFASQGFEAFGKSRQSLFGG